MAVSHDDGGDTPSTPLVEAATTEVGTDVDDEAAGPDRSGAMTPEPPERGRRSHRRAIVVGAVAIVVVLLAGGWLVFAAEDVRQTTEEEARRRLDEGSVTTAGTEPAAAARPLTTPPAQGLYRYRGTGREETSFPPLTEEQGPAMPATVTAQPDGCWLLRIDYNTHHWQQWSYCTADGRLTDHGGSTFSRRSIGGVDIDNISSFTCDPPAVVLDAASAPGSVRDRSCTGSGTFVADPTTVSGTTTEVGTEMIEISGQAIATTHMRYELTYEGAQSGSETSDTWFDATTGLPVRNEHHITVVTGTPLGDVTYTEDGTFELETPEPV